MKLTELRPAEVIWAFWEETINIDLNSDRLDPIYIEVA